MAPAWKNKVVLVVPKGGEGIEGILTATSEKWVVLDNRTMINWDHVVMIELLPDEPEGAQDEQAVHE